jgi:hypothetical protein
VLKSGKISSFWKNNDFLQKMTFSPFSLVFLTPREKKRKQQPFHQKTKPGFASLFLQDMQTN